MATFLILLYQDFEMASTDVYYHKRAPVGLEAIKMKKNKLIQVVPYRNPKLTQFVFEQNIWEEPLLTALHLLYYC